ncbi:MAG: hypothetical protein IIW61_01140, partial [Bacteroidaceae bacterium]|nr:hypothetical protein [Bacteroidaceae bacterium]
PAKAVRMGLSILLRSEPHAQTVLNHTLASPKSGAAARQSKKKKRFSFCFALALHTLALPKSGGGSAKQKKKGFSFCFALALH